MMTEILRESVFETKPEKIQKKKICELLDITITNLRKEKRKEEKLA